MNGLDLNMNPAQVGRMMRNPSNIADMLCEEHPQTGESPAEIFADVINVQRADVKKLAETHGVDVDMRLMTPERAAELLAGTIGGEGVEIVVVFNELAEKRDKILREAYSEDEYSAFMGKKHGIMNTDPGEGE